MFAKSRQDMGGSRMEKLTFYKCTAPGGIAHHDGKTRYVAGEQLSLAECDGPEVGACGRGLHVVSHLAHIKNYVNGDKLTKSEFYEVEVDAADVIADDETKTRVRSLRVMRRVTERDFGIRRGQLAALIGYGSGSGYGDGYGDGDGDGDGYGYGYGSGSGYGDGYGDGYGYGSGSGDGSGYGDGYGGGDGSGCGPGYGSGSGSGYGSGAGYGSGE